MKFNERLKILRKSKNLTQTDIADYLNYGYTAISNYEKGRNEPSITDLIKIAQFFHVSVDYLLCLSDISTPYELSYKNEDESEFYEIFQKLDQNSKNELKILMKWLLEKQSMSEFSMDTPTLKVAENSAYYITDLEEKE